MRVMKIIIGTVFIGCAIAFCGCESFNSYVEKRKKAVWYTEYPPYYEGEKVIGKSNAGGGAKAPSALSVSGGNSDQASGRNNVVPTAKWASFGSTLVVSPFQAGRYIDVSGLPPGTLARDPYTSQEFIVPKAK